jgi:hypothetical protein
MDFKQFLEEKVTEFKRYPTKEEFLTNFKTVIDFCKEAVKKLNSKYQQTISSIENKFETLSKKIDYRLSQIKDGKDGKDGEKGADGRDGIDADTHQVALQASTIALEGLLPQIPKIEQIENKLPLLGTFIRDGLELLPEGEKLKIDAIENLWEELDKLRVQIKRGTVVYGGSSTGGHIVKAHDLSASLNGVLKTFSLPAFYRVISVVGSSFPFNYRETVDYTVDASGMAITFTAAIDASISLAEGQTLTIIYSE